MFSPDPRLSNKQHSSSSRSSSSTRPRIKCNLVSGRHQLLFVSLEQGQALVHWRSGVTSPGNADINSGWRHLPSCCTVVGVAKGPCVAFWRVNLISPPAWQPPSWVTLGLLKSRCSTCLCERYGNGFNGRVYHGFARCNWYVVYYYIKSIMN